MRRLLTGLAVAVLTVVLPTMALAGNQETANEIASSLRDSGQLKGYKIGVKFQDGTAWLKGYVASEKQLGTALRLVFETPGVTRVVNDLTVQSSKAKPETTEEPAPVLRLTETSSNKPLPVSTLKKEMLGDGPLTEKPTPALTKKSPRRAQRVPSTFGLGQIKQASAVESEDALQAPTPSPNAEVSSETPKVVRSMMASPVVASPSSNRPLPMGYTRPVPMQAHPRVAQQMSASGSPIPAYTQAHGHGVAPARYDQPHMPKYAWPSYASHPNYAAVTYPRQHSACSWPYIGPFYPYPQVPMGWRKVTLEWDDGWWFLDFDDH